MLHYVQVHYVQRGVVHMTRLQFLFWLDDQKPDEQQVIELIKELKGQGNFTRAIREGLRLWMAAQEGQPAPSGGAGGLDLAKEIAEYLTLMNNVGGIQMQSTGKPITAPNIAMPNFDDDDLPALKVSKDTHTDAGMSFLKSIGGLND